MRITEVVIYINRYIENKRQQLTAPSLTRGDLAKQSEFYLYPGQYVRRYRLAGAVCNFLTYCVHVYMFISHDVSCDVSLDLTIERSCSFQEMLVISLRQYFNTISALLVLNLSETQ